MHRKRRGVLSAAAFIAVLTAIFGFPCMLSATADTAAPHLGGPETVAEASAVQAPRHVSLKITAPPSAFVAGERGGFELVAQLTPHGTAAAAPRWNRAETVPLVVWIATSEESGIAFTDPAQPGQPRHHIMVRFPMPPEGTTDTLSARVAYTVNPRTRAGRHTFWVEMVAQLTDAGGRRIEDTGAIRLPAVVDTHLRTKLLMVALIAVVVFLFVAEWVRVDVVAIAMMVLLPELGLLDARDTFKGISSNAVMAIIGVMIISYGLNRAGLVNRMIQPLLNAVGNSPRRLTVLFSGMIAAISSVMQNTGAAVLFLPAVRQVAAYRLKIPVSRVLMPIGMAAILGGTLTMIGTSPLILLNDILPPGMKRFGFLELTPIGIALVVGGIAYLSTVGLRALAALPGGDAAASETGLLDAYPLIRGPFEIFVPADFQAGGRPLSVVDIRRRFMVNIVASAMANGTCSIAPLPETTVRPGHSLCVYGPRKAVDRFVADYGLVFREAPECFKGDMFNPSVAGIVEGVVSPRSGFIGRTIHDIRFRERFGVTPLAILQSGRTHYRAMADRPLQAGDAVLMHGTWEQMQSMADLRRDLIITTPMETEFSEPEKGPRAAGCFLVSLALMVLSSFYFENQPYNPIPLSVCLMIGAVGMVLTRVVTINDAYRAVDWRTVFLLGGLIPLGMAVNQTGTAAWIARGITEGLGSVMSPLVLLFVLAVLSAAFTAVISNVGACTLLVPLGISIATQIGVDPRVAAVVVGLGVSNSFVLPTHQVNALYMGPGGYRTRDYVKIGGILAMIYIVILVAMTRFLYL